MAKDPQTPPSNPPAEQQPPAKPEMSVTEAAKLAGVKPSAVLSFKDYGDKLVVVTTDGQKLSVAK